MGALNFHLQDTYRQYNEAIEELERDTRLPEKRKSLDVFEELPDKSRRKPFQDGDLCDC